MGNGGASLRSVAVVCSPPLFNSLGMKVSDQVSADTPVRGRGLPQGTCMIDTSQPHPLALIGCVYPGALDSCKSD